MDELVSNEVDDGQYEYEDPGDGELIDELDQNEPVPEPFSEIPMATGGFPSNGNFLDQNTIYDLIMSDDPPLPAIPAGRKDNMTFRVDNSFNRARIVRKQNAVFNDDCGAWTSCSSKRNHFVCDGNIIKYCDFKDGVYCQMVKGQKVALDPQPKDEDIMIYRRYYSNLKRNPDFKRRMTMTIKLPGNISPEYDVYIAEYIGLMTGPPQPHGNSRGALIMLPRVALTPLSKSLQPVASSNTVNTTFTSAIMSTPATVTSTRKKRKPKAKKFGDDWVIDNGFGSASKQQQVVQRTKSKGGKRSRHEEDADDGHDGADLNEYENIGVDTDENNSGMDSDTEESIVGFTKVDVSEPLSSGSKIAYRLSYAGVSSYKSASLTGSGKGGEPNTHIHLKPVHSHDLASVFATVEEDLLFGHLIQVRDCGYCLARKQLLNIFEEMSLLQEERQNAQPLSKRFLNYFLDKHPSFRTDVADIAKARGRQSKREVQLKYYQQLNKVIDDTGLWEKPQLIFALEEIQVALEKAADGSSRVPDPESSATVLTCVSATGQAMPPFLVFKGTQLTEDVLEEALPGTEAVVCEKGLNSSVLQDFIESHFVQHQPSPGEGKILVLFEGTHCHLTAPLLKWAREQSIIFFPLPPHRGQLIEDQHNSCFDLFRKCWDLAFVDFAASSATTCLSQRDLCSLICKAYGEASSVRSVTGFFKQTGIFPFVPKYVALVRRGNTVKALVVPSRS